MLALLSACSSQDSLQLTYIETIELDSIAPIGLAADDASLWISDSDHNRIVQINAFGKPIKLINDIERPMHLDIQGNTMYIPAYGGDIIHTISNSKMGELQVDIELDAPAGISVSGDMIAIADFYNHQIAFQKDGTWSTIGKKGKGKGELDYPTDVQIIGDQIFVADAYNNRIQIFNTNGESISIIGEEEKMNAATGIYATSEYVFITDFENDRVFGYDHNGNLLVEILEHLDKPTDLIIKDGELLVTNYGSRSIAKFNISN